MKSRLLLCIMLCNFLYGMHYEDNHDTSADLIPYIQEFYDAIGAVNQDPHALVEECKKWQEEENCYAYTHTKPLYAPWRASYTQKASTQSGEPSSCPFCIPLEKSDNIVVSKGAHCYEVLNKFPSELLTFVIIPHKHVKSLHELTQSARREFFATGIRRIKKIKETYRINDIEFLCNLEGLISGASLPGHAHGQVKCREKEPSIILRKLFTYLVPYVPTKYQDDIIHDNKKSKLIPIIQNLKKINKMWLTQYAHKKKSVKKECGPCKGFAHKKDHFTITQTNDFIVRFNPFDGAQGQIDIYTKNHKLSFDVLSENQISELEALISKSIDSSRILISPVAYNIDHHASPDEHPCISILPRCIGDGAGHQMRQEIAYIARDPKKDLEFLQNQFKGIHD